ncbi:MAG: hypothetical protein FWF51_03450 [Chitinivibrionia bacterium]|nr:hypothetical protein [Chitinivibrionia bacterium]
MKKILLFLIILVFPAMSFAKGEVVGYLPEYRSAPTNEQLDRLTHLILFSATPTNHDVSLPSGGWVNTLSDILRGRILFEQNIAISANVASVAIPKDISRNQAAILQVKTNSGFNLTKRILIK